MWKLSLNAVSRAEAFKDAEDVIVQALRSSEGKKERPRRCAERRLSG
jgi:hypothetical protein